MPGFAKILSLRGSRKKLLWRVRVFSTHGELTKGIIHSQPKFAPALFVFPGVSRWRNAIHSFFCPHFDAVFIGPDLRITDVLPVPPNQFFVMPSQKCKYLLELPAGEAWKKRVKVGDKISIVAEK